MIFLEDQTHKQKEPVLKYIWELIRTGQLHPGDRIVELQIAKKLGVAQGVVREVLNKLEGQGIVENTAYKGSRLVILDPLDVEQILQIRRELEPLAIAQASEKVRASDIQELEKLVEKMKKTSSDVHKFEGYHYEFHHRLWEISQNRHLIRILGSLTTSLFAFHLLLVTKKGKPEGYGDMTHVNLIRALQGKVDTKKAVRDHLQELNNVLLGPRLIDRSNKQLVRNERHEPSSADHPNSL